MKLHVKHRKPSYFVSEVSVLVLLVTTQNLVSSSTPGQSGSSSPVWREIMDCILRLGSFASTCAQLAIGLQ